jgi:hypothetical protein
MFDEIHILFHFNIILKHNGMPLLKKIHVRLIKPMMQ